MSELYVVCQNTSSMRGEHHKRKGGGIKQYCNRYQHYASNTTGQIMCEQAPQNLRDQTAKVTGSPTSRCLLPPRNSRSMAPVCIVSRKDGNTSTYTQGTVIQWKQCRSNVVGTHMTDGCNIRQTRMSAGEASAAHAHSA